MNKNAIELLKDDHEKMRYLLGQLTETPEDQEDTRSQLMETIAEEIRIHTQIEEDIFYPALRKAGKAGVEVMFHEAKEEHRAVDDLILADLEDTQVGTNEFTGRAKVLKEMIEHHVNEEEEDMFPKAEQLLSENELQELGARMQELKATLYTSLRL